MGLWGWRASVVGCDRRWVCGGGGLQLLTPPLPLTLVGVAQDVDRTDAGHISIMIL